MIPIVGMDYALNLALKRVSTPVCPMNPVQGYERVERLHFCVDVLFYHYKNILCSDGSIGKPAESVGCQSFSQSVMIVMITGKTTVKDGICGMPSIIGNEWWYVQDG